MVETAFTRQQVQDFRDTTPITGVRPEVASTPAPDPIEVGSKAQDANGNVIVLTANGWEPFVSDSVAPGSEPSTLSQVMDFLNSDMEDGRPVLPDAESMINPDAAGLGVPGMVMTSPFMQEVIPKALRDTAVGVGTLPSDIFSGLGQWALGGDPQDDMVSEIGAVDLSDPEAVSNMRFLIEDIARSNPYGDQASLYSDLFESRLAAHSEAQGAVSTLPPPAREPVVNQAVSEASRSPGQAIEELFPGPEGVLNEVLPEQPTSSLAGDVTADLARFIVPAVGASMMAAQATRGAPLAYRAGAEILAAGTADAAVAVPGYDQSIGDLVGAGPTQTLDKETNLGERLAIGGEAMGLATVVEGLIAALRRGGSAAGKIDPEEPPASAAPDPEPDAPPSLDDLMGDFARRQQEEAEAAAARGADEAAQEPPPGAEKPADEPPGAQEPPPGTATNQSQPFDAAAGLHPAGNDGFVISTGGQAVRFADQKQAGRWILNVGNQGQGRQIFEIANHPSGQGFSVRVRGMADEAPAGAAAEDVSPSSPEAPARPAENADLSGGPQSEVSRATPQRAEEIVDPASGRVLTGEDQGTVTGRVDRPAQTNFVGMDAKDILRAADEAEAAQNAKTVQALGSEDAAREFERMYARGASDDAMFARFGEFTPEQEALLYGNKAVDGMSPEEIRQIANAAQEAQWVPGAQVSSIADDVAQAMRRSDLDGLRAARSGTGSADQQADFIIAMRGVDELRSRGVSNEDIDSAIMQSMIDRGISPSDAVEILGDFISTGRKTAQPVDTAPVSTQIDGAAAQSGKVDTSGEVPTNPRAVDASADQPLQRNPPGKVGNPTTGKARESALDRSAAKRNTFKLDKDQKAAATEAKDKALAKLDDAASSPKAQEASAWKAQMDEAAQAAGDDIGQYAGSKAKQKSASENARAGFRDGADGADPQRATGTGRIDYGTKEDIKSEYGKGYERGQKWAEENPNPAGGERVDASYETARGHKVKMDIPLDEEALKGVRDRMNKLPTDRFYSGFDPALLRQAGPEMIGALVGGMLDEWYSNGEIGISLRGAVLGGLAMATALRLPIAGKKAFGVDSHATGLLDKAGANIRSGTVMGKNIPGLQAFDNQGGVSDALFEKVLAMRQATKNWQEDAAGMAKSMAENFTQAERALMSDIIEKIDFPGSTAKGGFKNADARIQEAAENLSKFSEDIGQRLVDIGMLDPDVFARLRGQYLHRYYANAGTGNLIRGAKNRIRWQFQDGIKGSWGKRRGEGRKIATPAGAVKGDTIFEMVRATDGNKRFATKKTRAKLEADDYVVAKEWTLDGTRGKKSILWRDYSPLERRAMGEIRDAAYRFARGTMEASHDLAMGTMFKEIADNPRWASKTEVEGWNLVPNSKVPGTGIYKFGKLAGMYVDPEVSRVLTNTVKPWTNTQSEAWNGAFKAYTKVLSAWKIGKTAYNPATHLRNVMGNVVLSQLDGDVGPYYVAKALKEMGALKSTGVTGAMRRAGLGDVVDRHGLEGDTLQGNSTIIEKARRAGLSIGEEINIGNEMNSIARDLAKITDNDDRTMWGKLVDLLMKGKIVQLYGNEDSMFKLASYMKQVDQGKTPEEAVRHAHSLYFDYSDVPVGVQAMRDTYALFISYYYKVAPKLLQIAAEKPHRMIAAMGLFNGLSILGYGALYPENPKGREEYERELLPQWLQGSAFGAPTSIRLPFNKEDEERPGEERALFMDSRYFMPGGDLLNITNPTDFGPSVWPQAISGNPLGGNPFVQMIYGGFSGKDPFFGRDLYPYPDVDLTDKEAPAWQKWENVKALSRWLSYQALPPTATWSVDKLGNAAVGDDLLPEDGGVASFMEWTGTDYAGRQLSISQALAQIVGIKINDVNPEEQAQFRTSENVGRVQDAVSDLIGATLNQTKGEWEVEERTQAIEDATDRMANDQEKIQQLREGARQ